MRGFAPRLLADGDDVVAELDVTADHLQPYGIVHGGVYCALAETAARDGAATWLAGRGRDDVPRTSAVGTQFLRATRTGTVTARATPVHRGRGQQLWRVTMTVEDRTVATSEVRFSHT